MKKMIQLLALASLVFVASPMVVSVPKAESALGLRCMSQGPGFGNCFAAAPAATWTISAGPGQAKVTPSGLNAAYAGWYCIGTSGTRTITAVGVGSTTVQCRN